MEDLEASGDYHSRLVSARAYNAANRWKKRGMSLVPMRYEHHFGAGDDWWVGLKFNCVISVYGGDGSVSVAHGGGEIFFDNY